MEITVTKIFIRLTGICFSLLFCCFSAYPQTRLVLNGAKINIANGASLVLTNPDSNAIVRQSGFIISEGENNTLHWHTATSAGTYSIPWGVGPDSYIPVKLTIRSGSGSGYYILSTYQADNLTGSDMPTGVANLNLNGSDVSPVALNRFWQISPINYSVNPTVKNLTFSYAEGALTTGGKNLEETNFKPLVWDQAQNQLTEPAASVAVDAATNMVTLQPQVPDDLSGWWLLAERLTPLPVELLHFQATVRDGQVKLTWATASEIDNDFFTVEKSRNGRDFEFVATVKGAGNSQQVNSYHYLDQTPFAWVSYYRLKQTDYSGKEKYSKTEAVEIRNGGRFVANVYPNPVTGRRLYIALADPLKGAAQIGLFDILGRKVPFTISRTEQQVTEINIDASVKPGPYVLQFSVNEMLVQKKVLLN